MIKKLLYIIGGLVLITVLAVLVLLANLSTVGPYVVKKVTGGEVAVSKFEYSFDNGKIVLKLSDITIKGNLKGTVKKLDVIADLRNRPFLKSTTITDFDLAFADLKGKTSFVPLPAELLEIRRGFITYNRQKIFIDELTIENLKSGRPFLFNLKAQNSSFFKNISASGEGLYKGKSSEFKGNMHIKGLDLARLSRKLKGVADVQGPFTFAKQSFAFEGPFEVFSFELQDRILEKPLSISRYAGKVNVTYGNEAADIRIEDINFLNAKFLLDLKVDKNKLAYLNLTSDFVDFKEVKNFVSLENIAKGSRKLWDAIQGGKVKIHKLHYEIKKPISADLEVKDMGFTYKDMNFTKAEGLVNIDSYKVSISKGRGTFKSSQFSDAVGVVSLAKDKQAKVKGNYAVNLTDIPYMLDVGAVKFKHGTTNGVMELDGNASSGYRISGAGKVDGADVSWQKISASARGSYRFTNDEITFDPLIVRKAGTEMVIRGKWSKKSLGIFMKGNLDVDHVKPQITMPFPVKGVASVDVEVRKDDTSFGINGDVVMDDISFVIPRFMKKDKGIRSAAHISASMKNNQIDIESFSYNLDIVRLSGKGSINTEKTANLDIVMNVQAMERVSPLFFFENDAPKGDLSLNIAFRGLTWPLKKIPHMRGFLRINNGFIKLPWLPKPLQQIDLDAAFKGDASEIHIRRLAWGQTTFGSSTLKIEGLDNPLFSLSLVVDTLDLSEPTGGSEFVLHSIKNDSLLARVAGDFSLEAGTVTLPNMAGAQLRATGKFRDRQLSVSSLTGNILGGYADVSAMVDLSNSLPAIGIQGKIRSMTGGHFMRSLGAQSSAIEGEGAIAGNLLFKGEKKTDFVESLQGNASMYSRGGTIRKWNLLAKVLSLLNLYDLFRGKVQFTDAGLKYTKMGASFKARDGVFTTDNFIFDSPSILVTGKGSINAKTHEVDGTVTVSPLVAIDKTMNKIPVVRSIIRNEDKGFIYASYNVKGNIEDPSVSLNYVDTVGGRAINGLKNILTLPVDLFERK